MLRVLLDGSDPTNTNNNVKRIHILKNPITSFYKKDLNEEQADAINFCLSSQTIGRCFNFRINILSFVQFNILK